MVKLFMLLFILDYFLEENIQSVCVHWPISNKIGTNGTAALKDIELVSRWFHNGQLIQNAIKKKKKKIFGVFYT